MNLTKHNNASYLSLILKRRSVRRFDRRAVSGDIIKAIVKAGQRAPTSCGTQFYSFILVNDTRERREILNLVTENRVLQSAPIWIFVCSDVARPLKMFKSLRLDCYLGEVTGLIDSVIDASLAAENMVIAAESLGLNSVFTIYHWKAIQEISRLLSLPRNVLPLLLLCIGYSAEKSTVRPRWNTNVVMHKNRYRMPAKGRLLWNYRRSNKTLVNMGYFSKGVGSLAENWQRKFASKEMMLREKKLRRELRNMGFLPNRL